jgi:hypothetical protein
LDSDAGGIVHRVASVQSDKLTGRNYGPLASRTTKTSARGWLTGEFEIFLSNRARRLSDGRSTRNTDLRENNHTAPHAQTVMKSADV